MFRQSLNYDSTQKQSWKSSGAGAKMTGNFMIPTGTGRLLFPEVR
jgi:hypothetical protein